MRRVDTRCLVLLGLLLASGICAAGESGTQLVVRQAGGVAETRQLTVDPAVPWSADASGWERALGRPGLDETGQYMWETMDPTGLMDKVAISDNGATVAIGVELNNHSLRVHLGQSGELNYMVDGEDGANSVAVSPTGSHIAYATGHVLHYLTSTDATPIWTHDIGTGRYVGRVAMSPDGNQIVLLEASLTDDSLRAWAFNTASSTPVWSLAVPLTGSFDHWIGPEYSADGSKLVLTARQRIFVVLPGTGAVIWSTPAYNTEHPARISANGAVLCNGHNGGRFRVWGWDNAQSTYVELWGYTFTGGQSNWATASAVSGDGLTVACGSLQFLPGTFEGYVAVFETYGGGVPLWVSAGMGDLVGAMEISHDGLTIAASSWGYLDDSQPDIRVWEKYDSTPFFTYTHPGSPNDLEMTPDGTRLIAGGKGVHNRQFGNGGRAYVFSLDLEGGAVAGTVTLQNQTNHSGVIVEAVGQHRYAVTAADGSYRIDHIPAGTHTITAHKLGFSTESLTGIVVTEDGLVSNTNFALDTVGAAPANLTATQNGLANIQLAWSPVTQAGRMRRDLERRVAAGDVPLLDLRGPVAAVQAGVPEQRSPWDGVLAGLDELDEADSIHVWRGTTAGGPYALIASLDGAAVSYADNFRVFPTVAYYYVITAVYPTGESMYSNEALGRLEDDYLIYDPVVPAMTAAVTFDGVINQAEWADAVRLDMSDVFGYDAPDAPQSVYLYLKYDDANDLLLIAAEDHLNSELNDGEGLGIYADDDDNDRWSYEREGTEGNYWAYYYAGGGSSLRYRSLSGGPYGSNYYVFANPQLGFSAAAGYVTAEVAIPMGWREVYELALWGPDKTPGLAVFMIGRDASNNPLFHGWWPQNVPSIVSNPEAFGDPSIQANLAVPPAPPTNITVTQETNALRVSWTDPAVGIDGLPLEGLDAIRVYRNGEYFDQMAPGDQTLLDVDVVMGPWYEYQLSGFVLDGDEIFEGPKSAPVGVYAGGGPNLVPLVQDDGSYEQFTVVDFTYNGNRFGVLFDMPANTERVYTIELLTNDDGPIGVGVAQDNGGVPGDQLAGPYFLIPPVTLELFTFHIPGFDPPAVQGTFWATLDWTPESPGNPGIGTDINGTLFGRSWYYTTAGGWVNYPVGNWMIRAGVGENVFVPAEPREGVVHQFRLLENYPNPFNPQTTIPFELAVTGDASLKIFNLLGQEVATLVSGPQRAGYHVAVWNGLSAAGLPVASGTYIARLEAGDQSAVRKILLMK